MSLLRRLRFSLASTSSASSSALPSPTPIVVDPIPNPSTTTTASTVSNGENGVVSDFGLLEEEEFQMQLALAISASDPDVHKTLNLHRSMPPNRSASDMKLLFLILKDSFSFSPFVIGGRYGEVFDWCMGAIVVVESAESSNLLCRSQIKLELMNSS
ncbi:hypothetical protein PIB30_037594 [Stylosanthes scabra]|uniref:Uncharacterized protein n=1 Tax=Stylosanthes scabra TaxID=79078 RepID=A0ABU6WH87_9FABA|nr:hypothetical protein [Stylosanthes scabra]